MIVVLVHDAKTGQMQFITEGCDQNQGCALMQQAIAMIQQQNGGLTVPPGAVGGPPQPPPKPRPRNVRETIMFPPKTPGTP